MMQRTKIAIGLGSNLKERAKQIREAFEHLKEDVIEEARLSSFYETEPWGFTDQSLFINAVAVGTSDWAPGAIVNYLKRLETEMGRQASRVNGPRLIDLDLLIYGDKTFLGDGVLVPHPRMSDRDFVLLPLNELWPDWRHPILKKTILELISTCSVRTNPHKV